MEKFLERQIIPKLTQEETDILSSPVSIKEIDFIAKILHKNNYP